MLGFAAGAMFVASSAAHSLLGWKGAERGAGEDDGAA